MERSLCALINNIIIGTLKEVNGVWSFQYSEVWLNDSARFALSPYLPLQVEPLLDGASVRHVQWYFDNLLPEEGQRQLLARDAQLRDADMFGLLTYYGAESAGSLTLLPLDMAISYVGGLKLLSDQDLSHRIRQMPSVPLTHAAIKPMSLAGAQHKLAVVLQDNQLLEPSGTEPSRHILKPNHPDIDKYRDSVINEWFVMRLADRLGLDVPAVYRRYVPEPVYLIERFDRIYQGNFWYRRHTIDACQLMGLDADFKYNQGSIENLSKLAQVCRNSANARIRLFTWLVFNILVGNDDAHLKNLSFLVSEKGIQLAPHYDLLSTMCYESGALKDVKLAWPILGANYFSEVNKILLIESAHVMGLAKSAAQRVIDDQCNRIFEMALSLYKEVEEENSLLVKQRSELSTTSERELHSLRTIVYKVIKNMVQILR